MAHSVGDVINVRAHALCHSVSLNGVSQWHIFMKKCKPQSAHACMYRIISKVVEEVSVGPR